MARVAFFALLALLAASVSAFVAPGVAPRVSNMARHVQATRSGVADAVSSEIDYEAELKQMEVRIGISLMRHQNATVLTQMGACTALHA